LEAELALRRCLGPEIVVSGSNDTLKRFLEEVRKAVSLRPDVRRYMGLLREQLEDFNDEYGLALLDRLTTMRYFEPDRWMARLDKLGPIYIEGAGVPEWVVDRYQEAVYTYVYGFYNASVSLCRSVIEGVLRIRLEGHPGINKDTKLNVLLDFYLKTLKDVREGQVTFKARNVKILADGILHDIKESAKEGDAKKILSCTKDFIEAVYK